MVPDDDGVATITINPRTAYPALTGEMEMPPGELAGLVGAGRGGRRLNLSLTGLAAARQATDLARWQFALTSVNHFFFVLGRSG
jgi:hypothetical protein